ncbi:MAG: DNA polymerase III subunit epsilon [Nitrospirota bacterium]|nr:DNA polymerase III subunit epsilon [Nitrospirota bacterium]
MQTEHTERRRQVVLDTETTGLSPGEGHRIVEVGLVEMVNRHCTGNTFHHYIHPQREIPEEAARIHGITDAQVAGAPKFGEIAEAMLAFIGDSPLVIHNAVFDLSFLNHELALCGRPSLDGHPVVDTLTEARRRHPRQRNSLDALCRRYGVDNSQRTLHGALLDAEILADVYVAMLGGHQTALDGLTEQWGGSTLVIAGEASRASSHPGLIPHGATLPVGRVPRLVPPSPEELAAHTTLLTRLEGGSSGH